MDVQLVWTNAKDAGTLFGTSLADVVSDSGLIVTIDPREKLGGMMPASPAPWVARFPTVAAFVNPDNWGGEREYLLAILGLLNARNASSIEAVDMSKPNVLRRRRGKLPFFDYHPLNISPRVRLRP